MQFKRLTYSDQIYEYLKKRIADGELPPGSPIKESSLSSYLEVSPYGKQYRNYAVMKS